MKEELKSVIAQFLSETREQRTDGENLMEPQWDDFIEWLGLSE